MRNNKKLRSLLSLMLAAATASQVTAGAFTDIPLDAQDIPEINVQTLVMEEPSEYGYSEAYYVDEDGNVIEQQLIPEEDMLYGTLPSSYDLRDYNRVTSIKNQGSTGTCWAHSVLAASESAMITDGIASTSIDLSEAHLVWFSRGAKVADPTDPIYGDLDDYYLGSTVYSPGGGNNWVARNALNAGMGAALESDYSNVTNEPELAESYRYDSDYFLENSYEFDITDRDAIKSYLMTNGALTIAYYYDEAYEKYTSDSVAYYYNVNNKTNHGVTLVGWDDNYSASNFATAPAGNGAWLCKNSWGTWYGDNGYFWMSYYDTSASTVASMEMVDSSKYSGIYHYAADDGKSLSAGTQYTMGGCVYTCATTDPITAVSFTTVNASLDYTIRIYKDVDVSADDPTNGTLLTSQSGTATYAGLHTVQLNNKQYLEVGDVFSVVLILEGTDSRLVCDTNTASEGHSFIGVSSNGTTVYWYDTYEYGGDAYIKALTSPDATPAPTNIKATAGDGKVTLTWDAVSGATQYIVKKYVNGAYSNAATVTGTSATITGLTNGTKYGFIVQAYANNKWTPFATAAANIVYATPLGAAAPKIISAVAGDSKVTLTWSSVSGATQYVVKKYVNGAYTNVTTTTGTSCVASGLTNGTKYGFIVQAYVNGAWTAFATASANMVYATPVGAAAPKITSAVAGDGKVTLKWSAVSGATQYVVKKYVNGSYSNVATTTATSCTATGLTNGTKYGFIVQAYVNGAWTAFATASANMVYATPVGAAAPKITSAVAGDGKVTLKWSAVSGATQYIVKKYVNGAYSNVTTTTSTSFTATGLTNGTKYGFIVQAYVNGAWTAFATASANMVYATPAAAGVPKITSAVVDSGKVTLKWNAVSGATQYIVKKYVNGAYSNVTTTTATSCTATGLTNGTKYGFIVQAYVNGAWTAFATAASNIVYATPMVIPKINSISKQSGTLTLGWSAVSGATKYALKALVNGSYVTMTTTTSTSHVMTDLVDGTEYGFIVQAYVNGVWTPFASAEAHRTFITM